MDRAQTIVELRIACNSTEGRSYIEWAQRIEAILDQYADHVAQKVIEQANKRINDVLHNLPDWEG